MPSPQPPIASSLIGSVDPSWRAAWASASPEQRADIVAKQFRDLWAKLGASIEETLPSYPVPLSMIPRAIQIEPEVEDEDGDITGGMYRTTVKANVADLAAACEIPRDQIVEQATRLGLLTCLLLDRILSGAGPDDLALVEVRS